MTVRIVPFHEEKKEDEDITKSKKFLLSSTFLSNEDIAKNENEAILEAVTYAQDNWFNSIPLTHASINEDSKKAHLFKLSESLANKVLLFDVWNYSLLHSYRGLSFLKEWHKRYEPAGLVIVGIHTPFFTFSRDKKSLETAIKQLDIEYPVVMDNEFAYWHALETAAWPKRVLMNTKGETVFEIDFDGNYEELELEIQNQLRVISPGLACPPILQTKHKVDNKGGEIVFGKKSIQTFSNKLKFESIGQEIKFSENHESTQINTPYLSGKWTLRNESIHPTLTVQLNAKDPTDLESKFAIKLKSKNIYIVAGAKTKNPGEVPKPVKIIINLNKRPIREELFGADTSLSETRKSQVILKEPKLLHIVKNLDPNTINELSFNINNEGYETAELFAIFYEG